MRSAYLIAATSVGLLAGCQSAYAGVYIESVARDKAAKQDDSTQRMYLQDGMARIESSASAAVTIFKNDTMFIVDPSRKTYMPIDAATMERAMTGLSDVMKKMESALASMPPEQRAKMEAMLQQSGIPNASGKAKPVVFDAVATSATERAAGQACKVWNITRDGSLSSQVCVVSYENLPGKDQVQALAKKMSALVAKLPENLRNAYNANPLQQDSVVSAKLNGVPFITRSYRNGAIDGKEIVVKTWAEQAVKATQFDIPTDYVKQEMPNLNQLAK